MDQDNLNNIPKQYQEFYKDNYEQNPSIFPETVYYGNAYIPFQQWSGKLYSPEESFSAGTIFPELNQPYLKGGRTR